MDERLTANFWLSELLVSDDAVRLGIDNRPNAKALANVRNVLAPGLQRIRDLLGKPMLVSSGYRSEALNVHVGGSATSQHRFGQAADFRAPDFGDPKTICRAIMDAAAKINFDQLIWEGRWVHCSFAAPGVPPRHQVLTATFSGRKANYTPGLA